MRRAFIAALLLWLGLAGAAHAQEGAQEAPSPGVEQLRHVIGVWDVTTEFLNAGGSVARAAEGTYSFEWVIPDRLVSGVSRIPAMDIVSGLLFYVRPASGEIEMVSVGRDGQLFVMTGPDGEEVRTTGDVPTSDGGQMRLRFTRYNVEADGFESKMEYSTDGGETWVQGNRQVFRRAEG